MVSQVGVIESRFLNLSRHLYAAHHSPTALQFSIIVTPQFVIIIGVAIVDVNLANELTSLGWKYIAVFEQGP
jgi:hypothetical protein